MFFASFFGVFFLNKFGASHHEDIGQINVNALVAPTINTIILVLSGIFAGWSHGVFTKKWKPFLGKESWNIGGSLFVANLKALHAILGSGDKVSSNSNMKDIHCS